MSSKGGQRLDRSSSMLLLRCPLHRNISLDFPETYHMNLSLQLASERESSEVQCAVKLPSKVLIEVEILTS